MDVKKTVDLTCRGSKLDWGEQRFYLWWGGAVFQTSGGFCVRLVRLQLCHSVRYWC